MMLVLPHILLTQEIKLNYFEKINEYNQSNIVILYVIICSCNSKYSGATYNVSVSPHYSDLLQPYYNHLLDITSSTRQSIGDGNQILHLVIL